MSSGRGPLWRLQLDSGPVNSPAVVRFLSCRWRKPAEDGLPDHCTHRDVLPMTGTAGFVPDSWCPDCPYYKAKRAPKPRPAPEAPYRWNS